MDLLPKGELAREAIMLRSTRRARWRRRPLGERTGGRIVGMISIDARPDANPDGVTDRRVPGHLRGDLIIGAHGATAAATLVERTSRFTVILGLPEGKSSDALADVLIEHVHVHARTVPRVRGCSDRLLDSDASTHPQDRLVGVSSPRPRH